MPDTDSGAGTPACTVETHLPDSGAGTPACRVETHLDPPGRHRQLEDWPGRDVEAKSVGRSADAAGKSACATASSKYSST